MRDHHDETRPGKFFKQGADVQRALFIKIPGGFICKDDLRGLGDSPCDGDPLLLAARKLSDQAFSEAKHVHLPEGILHPLQLLPLIQIQRMKAEVHVIGRRMLRKQVIILEHVAEVHVPLPLHLAVIGAGDARPIDLEQAAVKGVKPAHGVEQTGLAAARTAEDAHETGFGKIETDTVKDFLRGPCSGTVRFFQIPDRDHAPITSSISSPSMSSWKPLIVNTCFLIDRAAAK